VEPAICIFVFHAMQTAASAELEEQPPQYQWNGGRHFLTFPDRTPSGQSASDISALSARITLD